MKIQYLLIVLMFFSGLVPITVGYDPQLPSTVYVDATYGSGTPGWGTDHFATIQNGIGGVAVDGTVIVHPGTYDSISVNKRVILKGDNRNTVIIDGGGSGTVASFLTDGINMSGFTIQHGDVAIDLLSDDNVIFMNKIINNVDGVVFVESDRNTFYYNDFIDNTGVGMELYNYDNFYNLFYFNNFLNCTAIDDHPGFDDTYNRWNLSYGTYPDGILGGNYWYDIFSFTDIKYGPNQNIPGSDGICDNEYTCGRSGVDYYPHTEWIYPPTDTPPVLSDMNPENASVLIDTTISDIEVKITDTRPFNWSIEGSYINRASGAGDSTGIKTATLNTPLPAFTTIYWYVNISDGMYIINQRFSFSTTSPDGGNTLQDVINSAPEGSTLNFPRGTYESDNAIIDKPLTLNGFHNETIIDAGGVGNGFLIESDNVKISNMTIMNTGDIALTLPLKRYEHQSGGIDDSYPITSDRNKGQSFKTGYNGDTDKVLLNNIKIYLDITGPDTYDVDVRLMMCTPGNHDSDLVGPIGNIHTIPRGALVNGWNTIDFSDDNYVLENNTWYGVAVAPNAIYTEAFGNVSGDVSWGANTGNPYGQGHAQISDTFTWIYWSDIATNSDFMFEIWGYNTTSEEYAGVFLNNSHFSEVKNCVITDTRNGIWVNNGDHNSIDHNYINESFRGIYVSSSIYNSINGNNVSGVFDTFTFRANGCTMPIYFRSADYNNVTNNTIDYNDGTGIIISTSTYVKIYRNHIYRNNGDGIHIYTMSHYAYILDNVIGENEDNGINVELSTGDTISNNDIGVNNNYGILLFFDVDNCSVNRNIVHSNINIGIGVWMTSDTKVFKNNVSGNENGGIYVYYDAYRNKIYENNIYGYSWDYGLPEYQPWGIKVALGTAGNKIYHNNFFDLPPINVTRDNNAIDEMPEGTNFWNDSYPSGGNYYEDFHNDSQGAYDRYRGNYQSIPGEDGICDENSPAPYINGYMIDWYPLRSPYTGIDLTSAGFSYMPIAPKEKARVNFTSLDVPSENIVSWIWDFGDGTTGEGRQVYHNYPLRGFYNVELRVINNRGFSDSSVQRIFIGPRGPFIPDPEPAKYPGFTMEEMYRLLRAYDLPSSNETMTIFVIDSGVFPATYEGIDLTKIDSQYGTGFISGKDENGHGTWVNYAISWLTSKRLPNVKQISYRIFDAEGSSSDELFMQAFDVAERLHPDVISISAGALGSSGDQFSKKVEQLRSEGILVVVASGNFGPTVATVLSPGCSLGAFTVAGSDPQWYGNESTDFRRYGILDLSDDEIESWSSRGPVPGIYPKPDVTAPGESILGPWVAQPSKSQLITKALSGTSMATPLISASSLVVLAQSKGQADFVKMLYFWNKGVAVTAFEDAVREGAVKKGAVNDWGAGIAQFDEIQQAYAGKLQFLIYIWFGALAGIIIIILVVTVLVLRRSKTPRRAKSSWGKWTSSKTKSSWKGW